MEVAREPVSIQLVWWGSITWFCQWIVRKRIRYFTFTVNYFDKLTAICLLIILFVFAEEETVEDADDNDGIDIEYQHWWDDEIRNFSGKDHEDWKKLKKTYYK